MVAFRRIVRSVSGRRPFLEGTLSLSLRVFFHVLVKTRCDVTLSHNSHVYASGTTGRATHLVEKSGCSIFSCFFVGCSTSLSARMRVAVRRKAAHGARKLQHVPLWDSCNWNDGLQISKAAHCWQVRKHFSGVTYVADTQPHTLE